METGEPEKGERVGPGKVRALKGKASENEEVSFERRGGRENTSQLGRNGLKKLRGDRVREGPATE